VPFDDGGKNAHHLDQLKEVLDKVSIGGGLRSSEF
jgi:phosphoribosylformimino-5-aminoimidazole carboxamide ribonucleotide (ProFAR) isomerase